MGRRYRHLWSELVSFDNLWLAYRQAARGKRHRATTAEFEFNLENNLVELRAELQQGAYQPGAYTSFFIHDPKQRLISAAPFRDRVVHHALINLIEPLYERKFIYDTYANRAGKGTHRALDRCTHYLRRFDYLLPLDICQFFPSIDHTCLESMLAQTIADERVLDLGQRILASGQGLLADEYTLVYFPGDDLFAASRPRGLPIGNLTSQFWANVYLNGLDHFIKRDLKCPGYVRYVDDMCLFAHSKAELHEWGAAVRDYLATLRLTLHEARAQPRPSRTGVPFLGFQVFSDHRRLKRAKVVQARRRMQHYARQYQRGELTAGAVQTRVQAWLGHVRHGDTWGLRSALLSQIPFRAHPGDPYDGQTIAHFHQDV